LISFVVSERWKAGGRLPPERDRCQQFGIARTWLREALELGMLDSRVGDGTFVCLRSEFLCRPLLWAFIGMDHNELSEVMKARTIIEENLAGWLQNVLRWRNLEPFVWPFTTCEHVSRRDLPSSMPTCDSI
jgi:GntR family transcriptional repressor for pyruvate dehydrogenase complex